MSKKSLENNVRDQFYAIDICVEKDLLMPSLTLIYGGIDALASLNRPAGKEKVTRSDFINWCNEYILPDSGINCSATDLYAARCSILHTNTAVSNLSKKDEAAELIYYMGDISNNQRKYQEIIDEKYPRKTIIVNITNLIKAYKNSYSVFVIDLENNQVKKEMIYERAKFYFVNCPSI